MKATSWTPEKAVMVKAIVEAGSRFEREKKRAWTRATIGDQADYILAELGRNDFGIAEQRTISAGRVARRVNSGK